MIFQSSTQRVSVFVSLQAGAEGCCIANKNLQSPVCRHHSLPARAPGQSPGDQPELPGAELSDPPGNQLLKLRLKYSNLS